MSQISKIRNISVTEVNDHLIRAKLDIKSVNKAKVESSKDVLDKFLELGKDARLEFIEELSLDKEKELNFKRELYKRILKEKNADDLIVLIILQLPISIIDIFPFLDVVNNAFPEFDKLKDVGILPETINSLTQHPCVIDHNLIVSSYEDDAIYSEFG